jgi:protein involved in polysaccharide export with SLBB domain
MKYLLLFALLLFAFDLQAQPSDGGGGMSASPNVPLYRIAKGNEFTISVNLWGFVGGPGRYEVPTSTTLTELLSFAGGPTASARLVDIRIIHADTTYENRVEVFNLENWKEGVDLSQNPLLTPGDTIVVSGRALDVFFQTISIVSNILVIVTALVNFISFSTK